MASTSESVKKLLVISGSAPGSAHVGEIILRDLLLHYGVDRVSFAAVAADDYQHRPDQRLAHLELHWHRTEFARAPRRGFGRRAALVSEARFLLRFWRENSRLEQAIVVQARAAGVEEVLCVQNTAPTLRLGRRIAAALQVPLVSLVWDPPDYVLRQAGFARFSRSCLLKDFRKSLVASDRVAVVSDHMQSDYGEITDGQFHVLRHGRVTAARQARGLVQNESVTLGFAGAMYGASAWRALLAALDRADWTVAGRKVRIILLSSSAQMSSQGRARVEYLGFRPDSEADQILKACDACYLPQPFEADLADLCRYSFPTKVGNYLSMGLPVFVHSPTGSALGRFFEQKPFGVLCTSLDPADIISALEQLFGPDAYASAAANAVAVARTHFSESAFHDAIDQIFCSRRDSEPSPASGVEVEGQ